MPRRHSAVPGFLSANSLLHLWICGPSLRWVLQGINIHIHARSATNSPELHDLHIPLRFRFQPLAGRNGRGLCIRTHLMLVFLHF
jgi:hypothetical protein